MSGYKGFVPGEFPTAADMNDFLTKQVVMKFATTAARDTALSAVLREGMVCFIDNLNTFTVYSGSAWSTIGPVHGVPTSWTPVITQGATPSFTNNLSWYSRVGRAVTGAFSLTLTSSGTASNIITVSFPVTASAGTDAVGSGYIVDVSAGNYGVIAVANSTTAIKFLSTSAAGGSTSLANQTMGTGANAMTAALVSGDGITATFSYVAAADA